MQVDVNLALTIAAGIICAIILIAVIPLVVTALGATLYALGIAAAILAPFAGAYWFFKDAVWMDEVLLYLAFGILSLPVVLTLWIGWCVLQGISVPVAHLAKNCIRVVTQLDRRRRSSPMSEEQSDFGDQPSNRP